MNKEILEIILKANINYLCELYQYVNQNYFISYIDDDKERMNYYKEMITVIDKELRNRNYWRK